MPEAIATLVGATIGAGILGIPYVASQAGFGVALMYILLIGAAVIIVNLFMGEVALRTKGSHQLSGYAEKYLGGKGKFAMLLTMASGIYGALIAYLIGVGASLHAIFPSVSAFWFTLGFFVIGSAIVFLGLTAVKESELFLSFLTITVVMLIIAISIFSPGFSPSNLNSINPAKLFLPYGVVLFAFLGASAVPEMRIELEKQKGRLKKSIIIGGLIPMIVYILFPLAVVGVNGLATTEIATIGLGEAFGATMHVFANLFAVLAMGSSFLILSLALKDMYVFDYKLNKTLSWALTCLVPLAVFLSGIRGFIQVIGFAGAITGGLQGILIIMMHHRARHRGERKPEFAISRTVALGVLLGIIFALGMAYEVLNVIGVLE